MDSKLRSLLLILSILAMVLQASSVSVINSGDWRDYTIAKNHADLTGREIVTLTTPTEAGIIDNTVENPQVLYQGDPATFKDLEERKDLDFEKKLEIKQIGAIEGNGTIIVKDKFGTDAVAVLPYAASLNYSIRFFNEDMELSDRKPKIFYGDYEFNPGERYPKAEHINGTWSERNLKIADRMNSSWAVLTPRTYFDPDSLSENPVLFHMERRKLANFLDSSSIENLKSVGAENLLYAKELDILTEKDLNILGKTGRTFTGIEGQEGVKDIKKIETPYRRFALETGEIGLEANKSLLHIEFVNRGSTIRNIQGRLGNGKNYSFKLEAPAFSSVTRTFNLSGTEGNYTLSYWDERKNESENFSLRKVSSIETERSIEVISQNFSSRKLSLRLRNNGDEERWAMVQSSSDRRRAGMEPGETARINLSSSEPEYSLYEGPFENQFEVSREMKVEKAENSPGLYYLIIPLVLLVALIGLKLYTNSDISFDPRGQH